jgi:diguanylate cyclase (GGDEF)-like protein
MLATWGFGRMLSASEVSKLDLRLSELLVGAVSTAKSETERANAAAETLARSTAVQEALRRHDTAALRRLTASRRDVAIVLPGGEGQVGLLPPGPSLVRRVDVLSGHVRLGAVLAVVRLAPLLVGLSGSSLLLTRGGRILIGRNRGESIATPTTQSDLELDGQHYRALATPVGSFDIVALLSRHQADAAVRRGQERIVLAVLATLAAISLLGPLVVRGRRARRGPNRSTEALALVEGVLGAVHDADAMLNVVLETTVAISGAAGGRLTWRGENAKTGELAGTTQSLEMPLRDSTGAPVGQLSLIAPDKGFDRTATKLVSDVVDRGIAALENVRLHHTVQRQALTDELTDLANRRRFREALRTEVARSQRNDAPLSLLLADLDGFKRVNDEHGHQVGDEVLYAIARVIEDRVRATDIAARLGGDEFAILLPDTPLTGATALAEKLRAALHDQHRQPQLRSITASFGAAALQAGADGDDLLRNADAALYSAKGSGRDRIVTAELLPDPT